MQGKEEISIPDTIFPAEHLVIVVLVFGPIDRLFFLSFTALGMAIAQRTGSALGHYGTRRKPFANVFNGTVSESQVELPALATGWLGQEQTPAGHRLIP